MNKNPFEFECKSHVWSKREYHKTCLTCGVYGWKNRETGELEPAGFRGAEPLKCLKARVPSHPLCQLSVRSFNGLMNYELTNKDDVRSLLDSGQFPYIRNFGFKSVVEIANWSGSMTSPKTLKNTYYKNYTKLHAEWVLKHGIVQ